MKNFKKIGIIMILAVMALSGCKNDTKNSSESSVDATVSETEAVTESITDTTVTKSETVTTKSAVTTTITTSATESTSITTTNIVTTITELPQSEIFTYEDSDIDNELPIVSNTESPTEEFEKHSEAETDFFNDVIELPFVPAN